LLTQKKFQFVFSYLMCTAISASFMQELTSYAVPYLQWYFDQFLKSAVLNSVNTF